MYVTRLSLLNTGIDKLLHVYCVCVILNVCSTLFKDKQKKINHYEQDICNACACYRF